MDHSDGFNPDRRTSLQALGRWGVAGGLWLTGSMSVKPASSTPVVTGPGLGMAWLQTAALAQLPIEVVKAMGFYAELGLGVQWHPVVTDRHALQGLSRGTVQAAVVDFSSVLQARAHGAPVQSIAVLSRCPQLVVGMHPQGRLDGSTQWGALRGKRMGAVSDGGSALLTARLAQLAGLGHTDWVPQMLNRPDEVMDAYRSVQLDAFCLDHPQVAALEQRGEVRLLADTRTLRGTMEVHGGPVPGAVLAVTQSFARQRPAQCLALARGVLQSLRWLRTAGPSDLARRLPDSVLGADRAQFLAAFEKARDGFSPDGKMSEAAASAALVALLRVDGAALALRARVQDSHTNAFVEEAGARFRV